MTVLFVHGVPETALVWRELTPHLDCPGAVTLRLPGFGSPLPEGFEPTMHRYAEWLAAEIAAHDEVDLVSHDWGALLSLRVLADQPANVRSWVTDVGDLGADFRWHDVALMWIREGEGEEFMAGMVAASVDDRAALLASIGVPEAGARVMAAGFDETMAAAILPLYRSSVDIGNEWGPGIDSIRAQGLVIESMKDPYRSAERARRLAERTGSEIAPLPDAGHWWMLDSPARAAAIIAAFWAGL